MELAKGYRRSLPLKIFPFLPLAAILFNGGEIFLTISVGSHLVNISVKFESHWLKGFGEYSILSIIAKIVLLQ